MRFAAGGKVYDCTYLSATAKGNISLKRSRVVLRPRFHDLFTTAHVWQGLVTMDTRQRRNLESPLSFHPSEVSGFLNSSARTAALAKGREIKSETQTPESSSDPHQNLSETKNTANCKAAPVCGGRERLVRTWSGPSRAFRSRTAASISVVFRRCWELTPPTEIPPYL